MNKLISQKFFIEPYILEILCLTLTLLLFVFRTAIPFFKYPYIILQLVLIIYFLKKYRKIINKALIKYFKIYRVPIIVFGLMIFASFNSNKFSINVVKEIINTLVIFLLFFLYGLINFDKKRILVFVKVFILLSIVLSLMISAHRIFLFNDNLLVNMNIDYNFSLIPIYIAIISVLFIIINLKNNLAILLLDLILILFLIIVFISGSRRGLIVLSFLTLASCFFLLIYLIARKNTLNRFLRVSSHLLIPTIFLLSFFYLYFIHASSYFRNKTTAYIAGNNVNYTKEATTSIIHRYISVFEDELTVNELYNKLWRSSNFNSKDPSSGWGEKRNTTIYPLIGVNSNYIPTGTIGYKIDSSSISDTWENNAYYYIKVGDLRTKKADKIRASVFCFVSEDFDGTWVRISTEGSSHGNNCSNYNLEEKGQWQKLIIEPDCDEGNVPIYLYLSKYFVSDLSSLKGYAIFAYPQYKIIFEDSINKDISMNSQYDRLVYDFSNGNTSRAGFIVFSSLFNSIQLQYVKDHTWDFVSKVFSEDTTFKDLNKNFVFDFKDRNSISERTARWKFALKIYLVEYNIFQKLFGKGFDYLNWYGYYFLKDKTKSDYPHNPFLSILLYSGMIGLIFYLFLLYKVFYYYFKYIKEYYLFFIFFLITFFFTFFSGGSPFDPPIMGFFILLPFLIHSIHKSDVKSINTV